MSKPSEASGLVTFLRNGSAESTGDARYTLDPDAGDVERFGERGQPVVVIPIGDGHVVRKTMPRNLYVPSDEADDSVESFTLRVELDSIQRAEAEPTAKPASGEADPVFDALVTSHQAQQSQQSWKALRDYIASQRDGIGPKTAGPIADTLGGTNFSDS